MPATPQHPNRQHAPRYLALVTLVISLSLGGCNDEEAAATSAVDVDQPAANAEAAAPGLGKKGLATTAIPYKGLMGLEANKEIEPPPCPFLSDETAIAVSTSQSNLLRMRVANDICKWSRDGAFIVTVTNEPIESAQAFSEYGYNLDNPPKIEPQSGPGENAVALLDPTWDKDKPRIFAFGFEQAGQRIFISATGVETSLATLRAAADEISQRLPNAESIEPKFREVAAAYSLCSVWDVEALAGLISDASPGSAVDKVHECEWQLKLPNYQLAKLRLSAMELTQAGYERMAGQSLYQPGKLDEYPTLSATEDYSPSELRSLIVKVGEHGFVLQLEAPAGKVDAEALLETLASNILERVTDS